MSILRNFEEKIEKIFEGFFSRFKTGIQPIEIAKRIAKEMDANKTISISKVYTPNIYTIFLNKNDYENLEPFQKSFNKELNELIKSRALEKKYSLVGEPKIDYKTDELLKFGQFRIVSFLSEPEPKPTEKPKEEVENKTQIISQEEIAELRKQKAWLEIKNNDKNVIPLETDDFKIGRLPENDLVLDDSNVSRVHALIFRDPDGKYWIKDLHSTNGTYINGARISKKRLLDRDAIAIGNTLISFRNK